jgi:glycosyltransferase involved in cell wall biosynthesis
MLLANFRRPRRYMTNGQLKVSAVIPAHNSAATIARALDSVLAQTRSPTEIIVVDDASSDATCQIVALYASHGVNLLRLPSKLGAAGARNRGINVATGDLVAFLDADDEWLKPKLEKQVALIESDPRVAFVASGAAFVAPDGSDMGDLFRCSRVVTGPDSWKALLACNFVATSTVLVWRRHLLDLGGFDVRLKVAEDQDLFIRLALLGSFEYARDTLALQHEREVSLSTWNLNDILTYTMPMIEAHLATLQGRLSGAEIRKIRGERLSRFGRVAYARGDVSNGLALMGRSMLLGFEPFATLWYLTVASPPARHLKRRLGFAKSPRTVLQ